MCRLYRVRSPTWPALDRSTALPALDLSPHLRLESLVRQLLVPYAVRKMTREPPFVPAMTRPPARAAAGERPLRGASLLLGSELAALLGTYEAVLQARLRQAPDLASFFEELRDAGATQNNRHENGPRSRPRNGCEAAKTWPNTGTTQPPAHGRSTGHKLMSGACLRLCERFFPSRLPPAAAASFRCQQSPRLAGLTAAARPRSESQPPAPLPPRRRRHRRRRWPPPRRWRRSWLRCRSARWRSWPQTSPR